MSRSKAAHKREKARRHARQIEEGTRAPRQSCKKPVSEWNERKMVALSQIDREVMKKVLEEVKKIK